MHPCPPPKPLPPLIEIESKVLNPRLISFDAHGNLRYGGPERDRNDELLRVLSTDKDHKNDDDPNQEWYIMDSAWVQSWLLHVYLDPDNAPGPGPCRNDRLCVNRDHLSSSSFSTSKRISTRLKAKDRLVMATAKRAGDYRRVCEKTWRVFQELYPGSGPSIIAKFPEIVPSTDENRKKFNIADGERIGAELGLDNLGRYDTTGWIVLEEAAEAAGDSNIAQTLVNAFKTVDKFFTNLVGDMQQGAEKLVQNATLLHKSSSNKRDEGDEPASVPRDQIPKQSPADKSTLPTTSSLKPKKAEIGSAAAVVRKITEQPTSTSSNPVIAKSPPPVRRNQQFYDELFFSSDEGVELPAVPATGDDAAPATASGTGTGTGTTTPAGKGKGKVQADGDRLYDAAYSRPDGSLFSQERPRGLSGKE